MSKRDPIAYIYEASEHCPDCAESRFGRADGFIAGADANGHNPIDREGNEVGVVAPWDAFEDRDMSCGTCGVLIHECWGDPT